MRIEDAGAVIKTASGSAGIFACAAALLGAQSGFIGKVGRDSLSRMVMRTLGEQGVDLSHASTVSGPGADRPGLSGIPVRAAAATTSITARNSVGSLLAADDLDRGRYSAGAYAVHFPGHAAGAHAPDARRLRAAGGGSPAHTGVLVSFDPNIRQELAGGSEALRAPALGRASTRTSRPPPSAEGQFLTGETTVGNVLRALHRMGPRVVALTRDKDGAVHQHGRPGGRGRGHRPGGRGPHRRGRHAGGGAVRGPAGGDAADAAGGVLQQRGHAGHHAARGHRPGAAQAARRWRRWPPRTPAA